MFFKPGYRELAREDFKACKYCNAVIVGTVKGPNQPAPPPVLGLLGSPFLLPELSLRGGLSQKPGEGKRKSKALAEEIPEGN